MPITSLEIKDKTFSTRFRGFDPEEVDEFLDIVVRDYEDLVRSNHDKDWSVLPEREFKEVYKKNKVDEKK